MKRLVSAKGIGVILAAIVTAVFVIKYGPAIWSVDTPDLLIWIGFGLVVFVAYCGVRVIISSVTNKEPFQPKTKAHDNTVE